GRGILDGQRSLALGAPQLIQRDVSRRLQHESAGIANLGLLRRDVRSDERLLQDIVDVLGARQAADRAAKAIVAAQKRGQEPLLRLPRLDFSGHSSPLY